MCVLTKEDPLFGGTAIIDQTDTGIIGRARGQLTRLGKGHIGQRRVIQTTIQKHARLGRTAVIRQMGAIGVRLALRKAKVATVEHHAIE
jgi:hypothetical protein